MKNTDIESHINDIYTVVGAAYIMQRTLLVWALRSWWKPLAVFRYLHLALRVRRHILLPYIQYQDEVIEEYGLFK